MTTLRIAFRYLFSSSNRHRGRSIRICVGLVVSSVVLISVISIMDYLQGDRFADIMKYKSFPVVVENPEDGSYEKLKEEYSDRAVVFRYKEGEALVQCGVLNRAMHIRYIDNEYEGGISYGSLPSGALVPTVVYRSSRSETISVTRLERGKSAPRVPRSHEYGVAGTFRTPLPSDFDSHYIFLPLEDAGDLDRSLIAFMPFEVEIDSLNDELKAKGYETLTYKDAESSLYGAMALERVVMQMLLLSLFLVLAVQSVQNASMTAEGKRREAASMYLMGKTKRGTAAVFALSGLLLSVFSFSIGLIASFPVLRLFSSVLPIGFNVKLVPDMGMFFIVSSFFSLFSFLVCFHEAKKRITDDKVQEALNFS